jgi:signal recognition particle receptor subunit beta
LSFHAAILFFSFSQGDPFKGVYTSTIGVDFEIKPVQIDGHTVNLQIWDTAGQERFRTITTSYYRSADAILLVFDLLDERTFANLDAWMEDVRLYAQRQVEIMVSEQDMHMHGSHPVTMIFSRRSRSVSTWCLLLLMLSSSATKLMPMTNVWWTTRMRR